MIAGRTRFYVVAGITGAIVGEALGGALSIGAARLAGIESLRELRLMDVVPAAALVLLVMGVVGGAWAGVAVMRWWYRREAERKRAPAR